MNVGLIVEGHGEVHSMPILLRRVIRHLDTQLQVSIPNPLRVPRSQLINTERLQRAVELTARKVGDEGRILILLDADKDLPCVLGPQLLARARECRPDRDISVVVATREYEAWFLAAAESLRGKRGLPADLTPPDRPESIRGAKEWLNERMPSGYRETLDQPALSEVFDLAMARRADSFDKLFREIGRLMGLSVPPR